MDRPRIAIIIPSYEQMEYVQRSVITALDNTPDSLVILVDDASQSWTGSWLRRLPRKRLIVHRFQKRGGLTRNWNYGISLAKRHSAEVIVAANSDVSFPVGWFKSIDGVLKQEPLALVGPITNAPGHRVRQQVAHWLPGYKLTDKLQYLNEAQRSIFERYAYETRNGPINGFCMAALSSAWDRFAFSEHYFFDPARKMTRNEDELQGRWKRHGGVIRIALGSFVFHFRGVSRGGAATRGREGRGWFRIAKKKTKKAEKI